MPEAWLPLAMGERISEPAEFAILPQPTGGRVKRPV
jgi:hypothetical protein